MKRFIVARWQDFTRAFTGWTGVALAALLGMILGVGAFTVHYSGATDYLGDDPASCANCHAMNGPTTRGPGEPRCAALTGP